VASRRCPRSACARSRPRADATRTPTSTDTRARNTAHAQPHTFMEFIHTTNI
jgi:hypothetical protein